MKLGFLIESPPSPLSQPTEMEKPSLSIPENARKHEMLTEYEPCWTCEVTSTLADLKNLFH